MNTSAALNAPIDERPTLLAGPRHPLLRARQRSLPADVIRSRHYSLVGSGSTFALRSADAKGRSAAEAKRFSLATFASVDSAEHLPSDDGVERDLTDALGPLTPPSLADQDKRRKQGRYAEAPGELVDTESRYLQVLEHINQQYYDPLWRATTLSPANDTGAVPKLPRSLLRDIFANFPDILALSRAINTAFESPLDSAISGRSGALVDKLLPLLPFLKQYTLLVSNFARSSALIHQLSRDDADVPLVGLEQQRRWRSFVDARKRADGPTVLTGLSLESLLLSIVQRVPRYRLLIIDIVHFSDPADPSFRDWERALALVEKIAEHLEAHIKSHEEALVLLDLQQRWDGLPAPLVQPSRRLLLRGVFEIVVRGRSQGRMALLLLSDAIVLARAKGSSRDFTTANFSKHDTRFELYAQLDLGAITVTAGSAATRQTGGPIIEVFGRAVSFSLIAQSIEDRDTWLSAIRNACAELSAETPAIPVRRGDEPQTPAVRRISLPSSLSQDALVIDPVQKRLSMPAGPPRLVSSPANAKATSFTSTRIASPEAQFTDSQEPSRCVWPSEVYRAPLWVADSTVTRCEDCRSKFGLWRRRHHCRLCGGIFCSGCANKYFRVDDTSGSNAAPLRACSQCFISVFSTPPRSQSARLLATRPTVSDPELAKLPPTLRARSQRFARGTVRVNSKLTWRSRVGPSAAQLEKTVETGASDIGACAASSGRRGKEDLLRRLRSILDS